MTHMSHADADQATAGREADARTRLLTAGASNLPRVPWLHKNQPQSAADLIQFALWRSHTGEIDEDDLLAALTLLPAARADMEQVEAAVLFAARSAGMSWPRISRAMGLASAQAAQQRFGRVAGRVEHRGSWRGISISG